MIDATGMPQTAVLIGGTSEIGLAVLRDLAARRLEKVVLAALAARVPASLSWGQGRRGTCRSRT